MKAGELRHLIAFDFPVETQDATGEPLVSWEERFRAWAAVEPISGRELIQSREILSEMDTRIRIRWSLQAEGLTTKWRARYRTRIYNLKSISDVTSAHEEIQILASSGLNDG